MKRKRKTLRLQIGHVSAKRGQARRPPGAPSSWKGRAVPSSAEPIRQAAAFESVLGSAGELVGEMDHQGSTGMSHEVQKK